MAEPSGTSKRRDFFINDGLRCFEMRTSLYQGRLVFSGLLFILLSASLVSCTRTKPVTKKKKMTNAERLDRLAALCLQGKPVFPIPGTTVRVICKTRAKGFFPPRDLKSPVFAKAGKVSPKDVRLFLDAVQEFASVYRPSFLSTHLHTIYVAKSLSLYGKEYGGTYIGSSIYVTSDDSGEFFLVSAMHSEFSSVLFHRFGIPTKRWESYNVPGWKYIGRGRDMLGQKNLGNSSLKLFRKGLLVKYSQASIEEDFNLFVEWLFVNKKELTRLAQKYPRIRGKYELTKAFYRRIKALR
jgi:hypothetical protein